MKKHILSLVAILVSITINAGNIYVAPLGCDTNDGLSSNSPVATINKALKIAREWRRTNNSRVNGGITIWLASGTYTQDESLYLRPEDSGTKESPTIIKAIANGEAIISGGVKINTENYLNDGANFVFTSPEIAGKSVITRSLWVDDKKLQRASMLPVGMMERMTDFNPTDETITIPASCLTKHRINSINDAPSLEMIVHQRWAIAILRVKDIKIKNDKAILSFYNPESRWEFAHPWPQPIIDGERGSSSFNLVNSYMFLDSNDEWFQDYRNGKIYLKTSVKPNNVIIPNLSNIVLIEGAANMLVHDIKFEGVTFAYSAWNRPLYKGHVTLQGGFPIKEAYKLTENEGLPWAPNLENQAWIERPEAAISIRWAKNVDFVNCKFKHLASTALDYEIGCSDINIKGNVFEDIGGTAILCGSFAEGPTEVHRPYSVEPLTSFCHTFDISNNIVNNATNEDWGCVGIGCGFVRDFNIHHNIVNNINYSGISVGWGWTPQDTGMRNNHIDNNTVTNFAKQLYDAGGIYTMSNQPNSTIYNNVIDNIGDAPYATNYRGFYIYFDAETDGYTVKGNKMPEFKLGYNNPGAALKIIDTPESVVK